MIIYPAKIERENTVIVDGYSDRKTLNAAIKDFGRFIEKHFKNGEGQALIDMVNDGITEFNTPFVPAKDSEGGYFFEMEEVSTASKYDEALETMDYREANYYFCMRFVK